MLKHILSLVLSLLLLQAVKAETPDSLIAYLKNSGRKVDSKDSADYYRVILPPDTNTDKDLYRIYDYYSNGKPKMVATSLTGTFDVVLDGICLHYFPNGKRKSTSEFKNGRLTGTITYYYPNGKLYCNLKVEDLNTSYYSRYYTGYLQNPWNGYKLQVVELRDSLGNLLAANGTGHIVVFDDDAKKVLEEGDLKNNKREGEWRGTIADSGKFICVYHKDVLKSGISYMKSGDHYNFKEISTKPDFSDGMLSFYLFIKKNLQYPESAKKHKVTGSVLVGFYVETNGTVSGVKVERSLIKSLDDEAIRVISQSPLWIPATKFGIPLRTFQTVSVDFYNLY